MNFFLYIKKFQNTSFFDIPKSEELTQKVFFGKNGPDLRTILKTSIVQ
jgi:hypothetical protein